MAEGSLVTRFGSPLSLFKSYQMLGRMSMETVSHNFFFLCARLFGSRCAFGKWDIMIYDSVMTDPASTIVVAVAFFVAVAVDFSTI